MIDFVSDVVIVAAGLYLVALGISCFFQPGSAAKFLLGHASSAFLHYLELTLRLILGTALVQKAPALLYSQVFSLFGWVLIVTTAVLLLVPWRWHRQFALQAVPHALRYIKLLGASSLVLGALLAASVFVGSAA